MPKEYYKPTKWTNKPSSGIAALPTLCDAIDAKELNKNSIIEVPLSESNIWTDFDNQAEMQYIKECAESVGMDVTDRTAFTIPFISEIMRRMNKFNRSKEVYNKGYKDGQEAIAFHLELCKDEGSIITVPEGATNGDMIKTVFPNCEVTPHVRTDTLSTAVSTYGIDVKVFHTDGSYFKLWFTDEWWNSPYRKEQPKQIAFDVGGHIYGVIGGDKIMKEFERKEQEC